MVTVNVKGEGTTVQGRSTNGSRGGPGFKLVALGGLLLITAAAFIAPGLTRGSSDVGTVEGLTDRVGAFWEARLAKDHRLIYTIYEPRLAEAVSEAEYLRSRGLIDYFTYEIEDVRVDGDQGTSRVKYTWKPNHPAFSKMKVKEEVMEDKWIWVNDEWRKIYEGFEQQDSMGPGADSARLIENTGDGASDRE